MDNLITASAQGFLTVGVAPILCQRTLYKIHVIGKGSLRKNDN